MAEKIVLLSILYTGIFVHDGHKLVQARGRVLLVYGLLLAISVYLGIDYLFVLHAPNLIDLVHLLFKAIGKRIMEATKLPS